MARKTENGTMKAAVLHGPGDLRVEEAAKPRPGPGQVLVEVRASAVCNSDIGRIARADVAKLPLILGHEFCGVVAETGAGVHVARGRRVAVYPLLWCGTCGSCLRQIHECCEAYSYHGSRTNGGLAEFVVTRTANLVVLPDEVSDEEGALTEVAAVALHAINRAGPVRGEAVVVIGAGTIGLLAAQIARARGAGTVAILDIAQEKIEAARRLGFSHASRADSPSCAGEVREACGGAQPGVVVEAAGAPASYDLAIDLAGSEARVVFLGNITGDLALPRERVSSILRRQLHIMGTWNSSLVRPENEWSAVHGMIARKEIAVQPLISRRLDLEGLPEAIRPIIAGERPFEKMVVRLGGPRQG
ncbi:MAG: alcohol dehydrogenase catalytic domain-containing protein [Planctomycetota bacterium]